MNKNLQSLLEKEVSRKEFLGLIGASILAVAGVSSLLKNLGLEKLVKNQSTSSPSVGYGGDVYGGNKPTSDKFVF